MVDKADDAIAMWQQMVGEMQKGFRAFGNQLAAKSSPGDEADRTSGASTAQQRLVDFMESYFAGLNLPSRAQLNALSDRLQAIEGELTDIKALLHEALMNSRPVQDIAPPPVRSRPTKRPPAAKSRPRQPAAAENASLVPEDDGK